MKRNYQTPKAKLVLIRPNVINQASPSQAQVPVQHIQTQQGVDIKFGGVENTENPVAFSRGGKFWDDEEEE